MSDLSERLKYCFAVLPVSSELRDYSEQVFEFIISEAVEQAGYKAVRADQVGDSLISPQALQHLSQDALVIADLTGQSPHVFYAIAIRHATRKPIIHLLREGEAGVPEFPGIPTLQMNISSARDARRCKQELGAQLEALEHASEPQDSPVSRALKRQLLEQSETLLDQRAAEMLKRINNISTTLNNLQEHLSQPENIIPPELFKLLQSVHNLAVSTDERLAQPEMLLPPEHMLNVVRNSGLLLNREDVDQMMNEIIAYAEDARRLLTTINPQLNKSLKMLNATGAALSKPLDPDKLTDLGGFATQIGEGTLSIKDAQDKVDAAVQKLDGSLGTLSQLYRNLAKLTL